MDFKLRAVHHLQTSLSVHDRLEPIVCQYPDRLTVELLLSGARQQRQLLDRSIESNRKRHQQVTSNSLRVNDGETLDVAPPSRIFPPENTLPAGTAISLLAGTR